MGKAFFSCLMLSVCLSVSGGVLNDVDVSLYGNTYHMKVDMWVTPSKDKVLRLITDYPNLKQVNDSIIESKVIERYDANHVKLWNIAEVCVLFYCKHIRLLQDVLHTHKPDTSVLNAKVFPKFSSFKYGVTSVVLREHESGTHVNVTAKVTPNFWVPPYIGAWLLQWKLGSEAKETMGNVERLLTPKSKPQSPRQAQQTQTTVNRYSVN